MPAGISASVVGAMQIRLKGAKVGVVQHQRNEHPTIASKCAGMLERSRKWSNIPALARLLARRGETDASIRR